MKSHFFPFEIFLFKKKRLLSWTKTWWTWHICIAIERSLSVKVSLWMILTVPLNIFHKANTEQHFSIAEQKRKQGILYVDGWCISFNTFYFIFKQFSIDRWTFLLINVKIWHSKVFSKICENFKWRI